MPAAAIIAPIAIDAASTYATSALIGGIAASTFGVIGGAVVTGAVGGAVGGAIGAAVTGSDPGISALTGAISSGVGGGISAAVPTQGISNFIESNTGISPTTAGSIAKGLTSTGAGFGAGTLAGLATGQNVGQALTSGAVSGIGSGLATGIGAETSPTTAQQLGQSDTSQQMTPYEQQMQPLGLNPQYVPNAPTTFPSFNAPQGFLEQGLKSGTQSALSSGIQSGLSDLFGSNTPTSTSSGLALPSFNQPSNTNTPNANNPTSQGINALTQALTTVSDLGYSPGGPVFGSQSNATPRKVWNQASLRVTDDTDNQ